MSVTCRFSGTAARENSVTLSHLREYYHMQSVPTDSYGVVLMVESSNVREGGGISLEQ